MAAADPAIEELLRRMWEVEADRMPKTDKLPKQPPVIPVPPTSPPTAPPPPKPPKWPEPPRGWGRNTLEPRPRRSAPAYPRTPPPTGPLPWWVRWGGRIIPLVGGIIWILDEDEQPPPVPPDLPGATFMGYEGDPNGAQAPREIWQLPDGTIVKRNPVNGEIEWPPGMQPKRKN